MYPLTCIAGFNVPARQGKFEVCGFTVAVENTATAAHVGICDDPAIQPEWKCGRLLGNLMDPPTVLKNILVHAVANTTALESTIQWFPLEPVKTRYGISIHTLNVKQGSFCLYVR